MDFDKIKKSFSDAIDLTVEKAKNLGNKALEFAGKLPLLQSGRV